MLKLLRNGNTKASASISTLSFSAGVKTQTGDVFEIEADAFVFPLRNSLSTAPDAPFLVAAL